MSIPINSKIASTGRPLNDYPWMKYPSWLKIEDQSYQTLFLDIMALRECYGIFFKLHNPVAQKELGQSLFQRLGHAEVCIYNKYDISLNAQLYAEKQIEIINDRWLEMLSNIVELSDISELGIEASANEELGIQLHGGDQLRLLIEGALEQDFLYRHPSTHKNFTSFALSAWVHRNSNTESPQE